VAVALKDDLDVEAELLQGSGGIFEIAVDGKVVAARGRDGFPTEKDVVDAVSRALGP
jgi:selenoprotein W-related protein